MAKVRFGPAIADARGSTNGVVFSRNRFGPYTRARVSPTQPRTVRQVGNRERLIAAATAWRQLTEVQRADWETLGLQIQRTNSLGEVYNLSGVQAFVMANVIRLANGVGIGTDAGAVPQFDPFEIVNINWGEGAGLVALDLSPLTPASGRRYRVWAAHHRSPGRRFVGRQEYRLLFVTAVGTGIAPADLPVIQAEYVALFGTPVAGQFIPFLVDLSADGFPGPEQRFRVIVAP